MENAIVLWMEQGKFRNKRRSKMKKHKNRVDIEGISTPFYNL